MRVGNCIKLGGKSAPGHLITPLGQGKIRPVTGFIHLHGVNSYNARLSYPQVLHRAFQTPFRPPLTKILNTPLEFMTKICFQFQLSVNKWISNIIVVIPQACFFQCPRIHFSNLSGNLLSSMIHFNFWFQVRKVLKI